MVNDMDYERMDNSMIEKMTQHYHLLRLQNDFVADEFLAEVKKDWGDDVAEKIQLTQPQLIKNSRSGKIHIRDNYKDIICKSGGNRLESIHFSYLYRKSFGRKELCKKCLTIWEKRWGE